MDQGSRSLLVVLPRPRTAPSSIVTPGPTVELAATQDPSFKVIGLTIRSKVGEVQSWLPVQRYAPCDTQALDPIVTLAKLSIHTRSPIQESLPTLKRHGNFIFTFGFITTRWPISAPNSESSTRLCHDPGIHDATSRVDSINQVISINIERPRLHSELSNVSSRILLSSITKNLLFCLCKRFRIYPQSY